MAKGFALGDHLRQFDGETCSAGTRHKFPDQLSQLPLTFTLRIFDLFVRDERPRTLLGIQSAAHFHLTIGSRNRAWIDDKIDGYLTHSGKLISNYQYACSNRSLDLVDDLAIYRNTAVGVQTEGKCGCFGFCNPFHSSIMY